jgi:hypothetical protein
VYLLSEDNHDDQAPSRGLALVTGSLSLAVSGSGGVSQNKLSKLAYQYA